MSLTEVLRFWELKRVLQGTSQVSWHNKTLWVATNPPSSLWFCTERWVLLLCLHFQGMATDQSCATAEVFLSYASCEAWSPLAADSAFGEVHKPLKKQFSKETSSWARRSCAWWLALSSLLAVLELPTSRYGKDEKVHCPSQWSSEGVSWERRKGKPPPPHLILGRRD